MPIKDGYGGKERELLTADEYGARFASAG